MPTIAELTDAVNEALDNLAYYRRQAVIRTNPDGQALARGLVTLWSSTLQARVAHLAAAKSPRRHQPQLTH